MKKLKVSSVFILFLFLFNCKKKEDMKVVINDSADTSTTKIIYKGTLTDAGTGHKTKGNIFLLIDSLKNTLRFEEFSVINGPDVNIYLSKSNIYNEREVIDLGDLKGTDGNMNYSVPDSVNADDYKTVLVWCKEFSVLFGSGELKK